MYIAQFVKGMKYSELNAMAKLKEFITIKQYGRDCFIYRDPEKEDIQAAQEGLQDVREIMCSREYRVIILDEANIATYYNLFSVDELLDLSGQSRKKRNW